MITWLETCSSSSNSFQFGFCNQVETTVSADVGAVVDPELVGRVFTDEIRQSFVDEFNAQTNTAQINFDYPIVVKASQLLELDGATRAMTISEEDFFLLHVASIMEGVLRVNSEPIAFEFQDATVINQSIRQPSPPEEPFGTNSVRVQLRAVCGNEATCTDDAFQALVDRQAPSFGQPLFQSLTIEGDELNYFNTLSNIHMQGKPVAIIPTLPPAPSRVVEEGRDRIPLWVWMLVIVDAVIIIALVIYLTRKRKRRVVQGDKLQDHADSAPAKRISLPSVPFQLKQKPTDKTKDDKSPLDLGDDEYDASEYDFSVEPADLSNGEYSVGLDGYNYSP